MSSHGKLGAELFCLAKTFGSGQGLAKRLRMYFILEDDILYVLVPSKARAWWHAVAERAILTVQIGSTSLQGSALEVRDTRMQRRVHERFVSKYHRIQYLVDMKFRKSFLVRMRLALQEDALPQ